MASMKLYNLKISTEDERTSTESYSLGYFIWFSLLNPSDARECYVFSIVFNSCMVFARKAFICLQIHCASVHIYLSCKFGAETANTHTRSQTREEKEYGQERFHLFTRVIFILCFSVFILCFVRIDSGK